MRSYYLLWLRTKCCFCPKCYQQVAGSHSWTTYQPQYNLKNTTWLMCTSHVIRRRTGRPPPQHAPHLYALGIDKQSRRSGGLQAVANMADQVGISLICRCNCCVFGVERRSVLPVTSVCVMLILKALCVCCDQISRMIRYERYFTWPRVALCGLMEVELLFA